MGLRVLIFFAFFDKEARGGKGIEVYTYFTRKK